MTRLKFGDALRNGLCINQVLGVIREDPLFNYNEVNLKVIETVNQEKFSVFYSDDLSAKKLKTWVLADEIICKTPQEAKTARLMKRDPKHTIGFKVTYPDADGNPVTKVYFKHSVNPRLAILECQMQICEDFFEYKELKTAADVSDYVHKKMDESERLYQFRQALKHGEIRR